MVETDKAAIELKNEYISLQLKNIYKIYLAHFDKKKYTSGLSDSYILKLLVNIFSDENMFNRFYNSLKKDIRDLIYFLLWEKESINQAELLSDFNLSIMTEKKASFHLYDYIENINPELHLFHIEKSYNPATLKTFVIFSLPSGLKRLIRPHFKNKPAGYELIPSKKIMETDFIYENNSNIINDLTLFSQFFSRKKEYFPGSLFESIKLKKNDLKFLQEALKDKKEFFDKKDAKYLKTSLLTVFLASYFKNPNIPKQENLQLLKEIITSFENNPFLLVTELLFSLGGKNSLKSEQAGVIVSNRVFIKSMFQVFRAMQASSWYSFSDIMRYISLRDLETGVLNKMALNNFFIAYTDEFGRKQQKFLSGKHEYHELVVIPLIKAFFFLFAALGLYDIKYEAPGEVLQPDYQGLKYVKLTALGAFLLGLSEEPGFKPETVKTNLIIDDTELTIKIKGNDKSGAVFLSSFAEEITPNVFKASYRSFLKDCTSKQDIEAKVQLFKKEVTDKLPEIWTEFFENILGKVTVFEEEKELVVYKLPQDLELLELLVTDPVLKTMVIKVEGVRIAVYRDNTAKVKKRLEQLGYLISNF